MNNMNRELNKTFLVKDHKQLEFQTDSLFWCLKVSEKIL